MKTTTRPEVLYKALEQINQKYEGNVRFDRFDPHIRTVEFTLGVNSSKSAGARRGFTGRRVAKACWHVHGDFFDAILKLDPKAKICFAWRSRFGDNHTRRELAGLQYWKPNEPAYVFASLRLQRMNPFRATGFCTPARSPSVSRSGPRSASLSIGSACPSPSRGDNERLKPMKANVEVGGLAVRMNLPKPKWYGRDQVSTGIYITAIYVGEKSKRVVVETQNCWQKPNSQECIGTHYRLVEGQDELARLDADYGLGLEEIGLIKAEEL